MGALGRAGVSLEPPAQIWDDARRCPPEQAEPQSVGARVPSRAHPMTAMTFSLAENR
jgi:hypothetical protein